MPVSHQPRVLVIDDDLAVRIRIADVVTGAGAFAVHEAEDGASGLEAAIALLPDLILLDIMMPGMSGFEVCLALRADPRTRELPVIVLSAAEESEAMVRALEAGADDFLRKPFSAVELRAKVKTVTKINRFRTLLAERDRFRWLFDHSLEPLIIADQQGCLSYANERARELFGSALEPGSDVATAVSRHFRAEPADAWAAWRELRIPAGESFVIFHPDTDQIAARWYKVELHALDGASPQTLLKFTNQTGNVRREIETFTFQHLISHKIRTPLNGIGPILSFLAASEELNCDEGTADLLRLARESTERLEQTLLAILDYQSALSGARNSARPTPPAPLSRILAAAAASAHLDRRIVLPALAAEASQPQVLEVVLTELLENYAKFSFAAREGLQVSLQQSAQRWELRLFAPGPGLPPDVLAQLGRPYAQLERNFSGEIPGMGLGLATIRIHLRSLGGDIVFADHPDRTGLVTTLHLPLPFLQRAIDHAGESRF